MRGPEKDSRGALIALQRGRRYIPTTAPLHSDGRPVALPGGPRCSPSATFLPENSILKLAKFCVFEKP